MDLEFLTDYERLLKKAKSYDVSELSGCFDKFSTLFTLYNLQYSYVAKAKNLKKNDNYMATEFIKDFIDCTSFCENTIVNNESVNIIKLIEDDKFYLKSITADIKIIESMKSVDFGEKTKGILRALYYIRCNLVHADKKFTNDQRQVLDPCIAILLELNSIVFETIKNSD